MIIIVLGSFWVFVVIDGLIGGYLLFLGVVGIINDCVDILFGYFFKILWVCLCIVIVSE